MPIQPSVFGALRRVVLSDLVGRRFQGFALCLLAIAGPALLPANAATVPVAGATPATFSVLNKPDSSVEWGGVVSVAINGDIPGDATDPKAWQLGLNGVPFGVAKIFTGPGDDVLSPGAGAKVFRLVLTRPDFTVDPTNKSSGDIAAATIRAIAPARWSVNPVTLQVRYSGNVLPAEKDPAHPDARHDQMGFRLASPSRLGCCLIIVVLLLVALVYAWTCTGALRDDDPTLPGPQRLFSLGRMQLAFWTTLVVGGYLFLYLTTGQFTGLLNNTASILLGISAVTTVASSAAVAAPPLVPPPAPAAPAAPHRHVNWLIDILSDANGMNLHRLQMVIWTVVFGMMFIAQLLNQFSFPIFDNTAYLLMGISSSTYVWLKRNEA
jgi:hypothetical protein